MKMPLGALSPEEYQLLVGPVLKVTAELAAGRRDPFLFTDMASMITLRHLVGELADRYRVGGDEFSGASQSEVLRQAPDAACMMALRQSTMSPDELTQCQHALAVSHRMVQQAGVLAGQDTLLDEIWQALKRGERQAAEAGLRTVALRLVDAVDRWEAQHSAP